MVIFLKRYFKKSFKTFFYVKASGFSLLEIAIALMVIGLLVGGVMKGQELLERAKLNHLLDQINQYRLAIQQFSERYGALPGDYHQSKENIHASLMNGNGDGTIDDQESQNFWYHLKAAGLIDGPLSPHGEPGTKLGGNVSIVFQPQGNMDGLWFRIGKGAKGSQGLLTPKQASWMIGQTNSQDPSSGMIQVRDGENTPGKCLEGGKLALHQKNPSCVLYVQVQP
jgi:type II secretory pathway pseudopilin PulG